MGFAETRDGKLCLCILLLTSSNHSNASSQAHLHWQSDRSNCDFEFSPNFSN